MGPGKRSHVPGLTLQVFFGGVWGVMGVLHLTGCPARARYHAGTYPQVIHKLYTLGSLGVCAVDHGPQLKVLEPSLIQPGH
jgi:hypothetical protein